ncbi:phosphoglucosamine mutase [Pseudogemmatithrix spongiicola]|uniref:Phosphoglucosamine mutase n=1 Tax=Pseudogemmatithrix spongiicola TaxID=3062599 RepID=A0AA49K1K2_9BACT|nr:phosphoglucosamine mutase [Gemmatimonadaceae bacterium 'strain 138']WKW15713.1 phosphoglucosamine mutase [Gemmatimonadaceae bacterium 'strain 318']
MTDPRLMISVSGIRGRVGHGLTPEVVARYAAAFGAWAVARAKDRGSRTAIVLGRDSRVTGPLFHSVTRAALESVGADVIDIGLTTTPTLQLAVEHHHAAGGLGITASHNPIEWNALKFIGPDGLFLSAAQGAEMRALVDAGVPYAEWDALGEVYFDGDAVARHLDAVLALPFIDVDGIRSRNFRVAYDACRGAGGAVIPKLLELLGCEVHAIELEADGRFPRPPEPVAENLVALQTLVQKTGAQIGFATDPDVDRLALVDDTGRAIGEDYTLALATRVVLRHRKGAVVTNLSTSRIVDDMAAEHGVSVVRAPVGEVNVALKMRAVNAVIGGEGNGGVILPELHLGRDAPLGVALLLQMMHEDAEPLSRTVERFPRYTIIKDKLDRPAKPLDAVYAALRDAFADAEADTQDGLRLGWSDRWVHIRPSGTEPIVRVIAEGPDERAARGLVEKGRELLAKLA